MLYRVILKISLSIPQRVLFQMVIIAHLDIVAPHSEKGLTQHQPILVAFADLCRTCY